MEAAASRCIVACHYDLLLLDGERQGLQTWVFSFEDSCVKVVVVLRGNASSVGPILVMARYRYIRNGQLRGFLCEVVFFSFPSFPHRNMDQATRATQDRREISESLSGGARRRGE